MVVDDSCIDDWGFAFFIGQIEFANVVWDLKARDNGTRVVLVVFEFSDSIQGQLLVDVGLLNAVIKIFINMSVSILEMAILIDENRDL